MNINIIKRTVYLLLLLPLLQLFAQTPQYENQLIDKIEVIFMNTTAEGASDRESLNHA